MSFPKGVVLLACLIGGARLAAVGRGGRVRHEANKYPVQSSSRCGRRRFVHSAARRGKARGWLRDQLPGAGRRIDQLPVERVFLRIGFDANPPYHQEGVVALALVLGDDPRLTALAKGYVDRRITLESQPALTFGNASIMRFLMEYQEATGDPRIVPWMRQWYRRAGTSVPNDGGWEYQGCHEHLVALYWLFNRTGDAGLLEQARASSCGTTLPRNSGAAGLHDAAGERGAEHRQHFGGISAPAPSSSPPRTASSPRGGSSTRASSTSNSRRSGTGKR